MKKRVLTTLTLGLFLVTSLLSGCASKTTAGTQEAKTVTNFPTKTITILNSSTAGSPADVMARQVAQFAQKTLGQTLIVSNVTGGSGGVMFANLLKEKPDGYTIATVTASQIAALQSDLSKDFKFDDFDFLVNVQKEPYAIAVKADSKFKTIKEMMDFATSNPGKLKMGGQGTGSAMHLLSFQLAEKGGTKITWVPFGGGAESVTNLLGGNVDVIVTAPATMNQYVEAGQARLLAISGEQRMDVLKDVPTLKELGYTEILATQYRGFMVKKGLPEDVKTKLVDAIKTAIADPGFKAYMTTNKQPDGYMGPEDFTKYAKADFDQVGTLLAKYVSK